MSTDSSHISGVELGTSDGWYSAEQVYDAWRTGRIEGEQTGEIRGHHRGRDEALSEALELIASFEKANARLVQVETQNVFHAIRKMGFMSKKAFIRTNGPGDFDVIVVVDEQDFLNPAFDEALLLAADTSRKHSDLSLRFDISYLPVGGDLDTEGIVADGFTTWYEPPS